MPNLTSLGSDAICDTLYCRRLISETGGNINAYDVTAVNLNVTGNTTTNGIINTGTITTDTLSATNVYATNLNLVYSNTSSMVSNLTITSNDFSSAFNHYRINISLADVGTPTKYGSIFLYLNQTTDADINQFVYTSSFLQGSGATTANNGYYPFVISWINDTIGYREDGEWDFVIDILNTQVSSRACEIRSYNLSYSNNLDPTASPTGTLGNIICNGYSYGNGSAGIIGTAKKGVFKGCQIVFGNGFASNGTAITNIYGYN